MNSNRIISNPDNPEELEKDYREQRRAFTIEFFQANLIMIMIDLYKVNFKNRDISLVETTISGYLPIYVVWVVIVAFGFPFLFGFR